MSPVRWQGSEALALSAGCDASVCALVRGVLVEPEKPRGSFQASCRLNG